MYDLDPRFRALATLGHPAPGRGTAGGRHALKQAEYRHRMQTLRSGRGPK